VRFKHDLVLLQVLNPVSKVKMTRISLSAFSTWLIASPLCALLLTPGLPHAQNSSCAYAKETKKSVAVETPGTMGGVTVKMQPQFQEVNDKFRQIYAETRTRTIKKSQPIIVAVNEFIILHDGSKVEKTQVISEKYTLLKSVDHIPLATFVVLELDTDQMLSEQKLQQIRELHSLSKNALASLDKSALTGDVLDRQKQLINKSLNLLESTLKDKRISGADLTAFCRDTQKMIMQNVDEAIADQLMAIDLQVRQWRKDLGPEKWGQLSVVVVSGHMPRELNSTTQYFSKALKKKREGDRIYYCEGLSEASDGLNLVGTHILDSKIAVAFFNDEWRMHRDLLSDGAAKYLKKHPPLK
jgi:hypothetical protein